MATGYTTGCFARLLSRAPLWWFCDVFCRAVLACCVTRYLCHTTSLILWVASLRHRYSMASVTRSMAVYGSVWHCYGAFCESNLAPTSVVTPIVSYHPLISLVPATCSGKLNGLVPLACLVGGGSISTRKHPIQATTITTPTMVSSPTVHRGDLFKRVSCITLHVV